MTKTNHKEAQLGIWATVRHLDCHVKWVHPIHTVFFPRERIHHYSMHPNPWKKSRFMIHSAHTSERSHRYSSLSLCPYIPTEQPGSSYYKYNHTFHIHHYLYLYTWTFVLLAYFLLSFARHPCPLILPHLSVCTFSLFCFKLLHLAY